MGHRPLQHSLRLRHRGECAHWPRLPERLHSVRLQVCLVQQAPPEVGIVIGPVECLLEPPVQPHRRRRRLLQRLELQQGRVHSLVRQQRPLPVPFQREQSLGKGVGGVGADEVPAVLPQRLRCVRIRVPPQRAPDRLVHVIVAAF